MFSFGLLVQSLSVTSLLLHVLSVLSLLAHVLSVLSLFSQSRGLALGDIDGDAEGDKDTLGL